MNSRKFGAIAVSLMLSISVLFGLVWAGNKTKLAYKMKKGENLKYQLTMKSETVQERMGQEINVETSGESVIDIVVDDVDSKGNMNLIYKIESMKTRISSFIMDSVLTNPEGIINKRMRQIITPNGKRLKNEQIDTLNIPNVLMQAGGNRQVMMRLPQLPDEAVGVGSSWTMITPDSMISTSMKTRVIPTTTYTATAEVDTLGFKCLRISYSGDIKVEGEGEQMGMKIVVEGDGTTEGVMYFAPSEGRMVSMTGSSEIDLTVALTGQMSMTLPSTTTTQLSMVLVK